MDPAYENCSTTRSCSNARIQFSLKENIEISQYAIDILSRFDELMAVDQEIVDIRFRPEGNLFLFDEKGRGASEKAFELQRELGCNVEWWSTGKIRDLYPLYDPSGLAGGTFSSGDGHLDAYGVLMGYKKKAISLGADIFTARCGNSHAGRACEWCTYRLRGGAGSAVCCQLHRCLGSAGSRNRRYRPSGGAGKTSGFILDTKTKPKGILPLTVLPSGLYFRTEGNMVLVGKSMADDPIGFSFSWHEQRFLDVLWPELAEFVPAFDAVKIKRGWAGLYAMNRIDGNAILGNGRVERADPGKRFFRAWAPAGSCSRTVYLRVDSRKRTGPRSVNLLSPAHPVQQALSENGLV